MKLPRHQLARQVVAACAYLSSCGCIALPVELQPLHAARQAGAAASRCRYPSLQHATATTQRATTTQHATTTTTQHATTTTQHATTPTTQHTTTKNATQHATMQAPDMLLNAKLNTQLNTLYITQHTMLSPRYATQHTTQHPTQHATRTHNISNRRTATSGCRHFKPADCKLPITLHTPNVVVTIPAGTCFGSAAITAFLAFLRKSNIAITPNDAPPSNHFHVHHISLGIAVTPMFHVPTIIGGDNTSCAVLARGHGLQPSSLPH